MDLVHKSARILIFQKDERFYVINNNPTHNVLTTMILDRVDVPDPAPWHMTRNPDTLNKYYQPPNSDHKFHMIRIIINQNILDMLDKFSLNGSKQFKVFHYGMSEGYAKPKLWKDVESMPELYFVEALI
jgi:hypothetical protein